MKAPELSPEEHSHIAKGGRVFIVEEVHGPLWRVLVVEGNGCRVMLKPDGLDGYSDRDDAMLTAKAFANLSADQPLVREEIYAPRR